MEFAVKFMSNFGHPICIGKQEVALSLLDKARCIDSSLLPADLPELTPEFEGNVRIIVSEEEARVANGLFANKNTVRVYTQGGCLNCFCEMFWGKDERKFLYRVDEKAIFAYWKEMGYPTFIAEIKE